MPHRCLRFKAASATGTDARLSVEVTKYGLNMSPVTAMNFDDEEFGASTLAPFPMTQSYFNSLSGVALVIDPASGEVLYGPYDNGALNSYDIYKYRGNRAVEPQINLISFYVNSLRKLARQQQ